MPRVTHLLPNLPEADRLGEERLTHHVQLVGVPHPPPAGVSDLHRQGLDVLLLPRPPRKPAPSVVPQAQSHLYYETSTTRHVQAHRTGQDRKGKDRQT